MNFTISMADLAVQKCMPVWKEVHSCLEMRGLTTTSNLLAYLPPEVQLSLFVMYLFDVLNSLQAAECCLALRLFPAQSSLFTSVCYEVSSSAAHGPGCSPCLLAGRFSYTIPFIQYHSRLPSAWDSAPCPSRQVQPRYLLHVRLGPTPN